MNKKVSLGFIYSFKESKKLENNKIEVKFIEKISKRFPDSFKHKKDFECNEIFVGDYTNLYLDIKLFEKELNYYTERENSLFNIEYYNDLYEKEYKYLDHKKLLNGNKLAFMNLLILLSSNYYYTFNINHIKLSLIKEKFKFNNYDECNSFLEYYNEICSFRYNEDLKKCFK